MKDEMLLEWFGVYDADGGIWGELAYVMGVLFAGRSCSLCDITHGYVREKAAFKATRIQLDVPLTLVHLNEQSPALKTFTDGLAPCVVARFADRYEMVFDAETLDGFEGDESAFFNALLRWRERLANEPAGSSDP